MMSSDIFVDVDGVLADFVGGVREVFGLPYSWEPREYDCWIEMGLTLVEFWAGIEARKNFWLDLKVIEKGRQLVREMLVLGFTPVLCTSPPLDPQACAEKVMWIQREFPELPQSFVVTPCKWKLAAQRRLLIDDYIGNVEAWREHGGRAWLLAASYNRYPAAKMYEHMIEDLRMEKMLRDM